MSVLQRIVNNNKITLCSIECLAEFSFVKNQKTLYKRLVFVVLYMLARKNLTDASHFCGHLPVIFQEVIE